MPKKQEAPLFVTFKPSQKSTQLLIVLHLLALGSSIANALPLVFKLVLLTGIFVHFWFILKGTEAMHYQLTHSEGSGWELTDDNDIEAIEILNSTVITTFAIFLHFKKNAKRQSLLILNDMLTEDEYRRLIVRLKTAGKN